MRRRPLILGGLAAGIAAGALAWWAAGGLTASARQLEPLDAQVAKLRVPRTSLDAAQRGVPSQLANTPLFALTTGPGAVSPPVLRLEGVSRSRNREAALLSIDDRPAEWMTLGEERDGVTLVAVSGSKAVVDTIYGPQDVSLGERSDPQTAAAGAPPAGAPPQRGIPPASAPPPGVPPASAPPAAAAGKR